VIQFRELETPSLGRVGEFVEIGKIAVEDPCHTEKSDLALGFCAFLMWLW
jgi:hypothetical protein